MTRDLLYFMGMALLTAFFGKTLSFLAIYFLKHELIHTMASIMVITISFLVAFYMGKRFIRPLKRLGLGVSFMLILLSFSVFLFYWLRPYTLYFSVWLFSDLFVFGLLAGLMTHLILGSKHDTGPYHIEIWKAGALLVFILLLVFLLPFFFNMEIMPLVLAFCFLMFFVLMLMRSGEKLKLAVYPSILFMLLAISYPFLPDLVFFENQDEFEDKVIYHEDSPHHAITLTQWMDEYWLYLDELKNLSTIDEFLYYEPFAHPAALLVDKPGRVLIMGGENGCLARELLKYPGLERIDLVPYDSILLNLGKTHPVLTNMNDSSLHDTKIHILNSPILSYVVSSEYTYNLIFADLPDPRNLETNQFYTLEFYSYLAKSLASKGLFITQAGSPYFATKAFLSIDSTMQEAGFNTLPIHNQILTLGEWGWIIGSRDTSSVALKEKLLAYNGRFPETRWLNREALSILLYFGKDYIAVDQIDINTMDNPELYQYYLEGNWALE